MLPDLRYSHSSGCDFHDCKLCKLYLWKAPLFMRGSLIPSHKSPFLFPDREILCRIWDLHASQKYLNPSHLIRRTLSKRKTWGELAKGPNDHKQVRLGSGSSFMWSSDQWKLFAFTTSTRLHTLTSPFFRSKAIDQIEQAQRSLRFWFVIEVSVLQMESLTFRHAWYLSRTSPSSFAEIFSWCSIFFSENNAKIYVHP